MRMIHYLTCIVILYITGCGSIRLLQVSVPSVIQAGETATLLCDVDMEGETLYSVQWYKDGEEFFRYVPRDSPNFITYQVHGVKVNESRSNFQKVVLSTVSLGSSGHYRCEVSGEAPSFLSVSGGGNMEVVVFPRDRPAISGGKNNYRPGEIVDVNCTSAPSKPAVKLRWYVNGKKANANYVREYKAVIGEDGLETTVLGLTFIVQEFHLKDRGGLALRCVAAMGQTSFSQPSTASSTVPVNHLGERSRLQSAAIMENMEVLFLASAASARRHSQSGLLWMSVIWMAVALVNKIQH